MSCDDVPWVRELRGELFASGRVRIGRFRRHPSEADFRTAGPMGAATLVFPRLAVRIAQAGRKPVVADPTVVMLYNEGQEYERDRVSPQGDRCDWFEFASEDTAEACGEARFEAASVPAAGALVVRERALFAAIAAGRGDPLEIEEEALGVLAAAFATARPTPVWRDLAYAAQERLARCYTRPLTLEDLATSLGCSPFHLCRVFRAATGHTVHQHLTALRLRRALDLIPERRGDLAGLALELGFSHHAHFTAAFRVAFDTTPTAWARRIARARSR
ncbi:MAG TPA: AraC family transcriptional regulator [Myxococcales bacterium]|nr:AraC family transcriptional regulator [Myxococcales bacterium]